MIQDSQELSAADLCSPFSCLHLCSSHNELLQVFSAPDLTHTIPSVLNTFSFFGGAFWWILHIYQDLVQMLFLLSNPLTCPVSLPSQSTNHSLYLHCTLLIYQYNWTFCSITLAPLREVNRLFSEYTHTHTLKAAKCAKWN